MSWGKRNLISCILTLCCWVAMPVGAWAITTLKQVQVSGSSRIDLLFDGKVGKSQVRTEFFNDIIQISLSDVAVYPAKISSVNGGSFVKIFAYQYAPKLVRCRLTVKGKAEDFKDRFQISPSGKVLSFKITDTAVSSDRITLQSVPRTDLAETALLDKVMRSAGPPPVTVAAVVQTPQENAPALAVEVAKSSDEAPVPEKERKSEHKKSDKSRLSSAKPMPSPFDVIGKLLAVIALFGALAFVAKKFISHRVSTQGSGGRALGARLSKADGGWLNTLGGIARQATSGLARKEKMIEVLSNHNLGPKKSIAVVRVMGRTLVLGVSNESINLISQLPDGAGEAELDEIFENASEPAKILGVPTRSKVESAAAAARSSSFSSLLQTEARKPENPNVRSQIRSRLEGLKQL